MHSQIKLKPGKGGGAMPPRGATDNREDSDRQSTPSTLRTPTGRTEAESADSRRHLESLQDHYTASGGAPMTGTKHHTLMANATGGCSHQVACGLWQMLQGGVEFALPPDVSSKHGRRHRPPPPPPHTVSPLRPHRRTHMPHLHRQIRGTAQNAQNLQRRGGLLRSPEPRT